MKILDRYLIQHFLRPLIACGVIFTILVFVGHFFDKMEIFNRFHAHGLDIFTYVILGIPYWLNVVFPVVTLLALMFSLGPLQQSGEITAMRSAGISSYRLYAPFFAMGVLISLISMVGGMTLFPSLSARANVVYRQRIKQERVINTLRDHLVVTGRDNQLFTIGTLDTGTGTMTDIIIDQFDNQMRHKSTLSAQTGHYEKDRWMFNHGNIIFFDADGSPRNEPFQEKLLDIHEKPEDFVYENNKPDDLTHRQLQLRIRHLHDLGVRAYKEEVALHTQFALPLANIVVILIGIPFALNRMKKGTAQMVFYAFAGTFLYWGTVSVFQSLGEQGIMPAWVSAWTPNFAFGFLALWMLMRATKA
jgi:lipopolysaccharide export system permease protein